MKLSTMMIVIAIFFFTIIFGIGIVFLIRKNEYSFQDVGTRVCNANECAVSLLTGFKRCPESGERVVLQPNEVCSKATSCSASQMPFAIQPDGSISLSGVCANDSTCNCTNKTRCADYILSAFQLTSGNLYTFTSTAPLQFTQRTDKEFSISEQIFCTLPTEWMRYSTPGCTFSSVNPTREEVLTCMDVPKLNNGNACVNGTLAYIDDSSVLGCVTGNPRECPLGVANVYDTQLGKIICSNR